MEREYKWMVCTHCFTYNQAPYIEETMNGFTMQETTFPVVTLIMDDASTDGEPEVIRQYLVRYFKEPYRIQETDYAQIICAHHINNHNCTFVVILLKYNHYRKKSKCQYFTEWADYSKYHALCEGDDYWTDPHKLQIQVDFLEKHKEYVLTYTDAFVVDEKSHLIKANKPNRISGNCLKSLIEQGNFIVTAGTCYRSSFEKEWQAVRANIPFQLMLGDKPHWLFLARKGLFYYFPIEMVAYRVLDESASHTKDYNKAMAFSDNVRDINMYFNELYDIGVSRSVIIRDAYLHRLLLSIRCENKLFVKELFSSFNKAPQIVFRKNFWKIVGKKILQMLNIKKIIC